MGIVGASGRSPKIKPKRKGGGGDRLCHPIPILLPRRILPRAQIKAFSAASSADFPILFFFLKIAVDGPRGHFFHPPTRANHHSRRRHICWGPSRLSLSLISFLPLFWLRVEKEGPSIHPPSSHIHSRKHSKITGSEGERENEQRTQFLRHDMRTQGRQEGEGRGEKCCRYYDTPPLPL